MVSSLTLDSVDAVTGVVKSTVGYNDPDGDNVTVTFTYWNGTTKVGETVLSNQAGSGPLTGTTMLAVGCYTNLSVTVVVDDGALKNSKTASASQTSDVYKASFKAPIIDNERNLAKAGSVVPVKVALSSMCSPGATVTNRNLYVQVITGTDNETLVGDEVVTSSVSAADSGTQMRVVDGMYIYNLSTKGLTTGQNYTIRIWVDKVDTTSTPDMTKRILRAVLRTQK